MLKRALLFIAASFGLCFSLTAEEPNSVTAQSASLGLNQTSPSVMVTERPAIGRTGSFRILTNAWYGNGPLTLVDGRLFSFPGAFGWVEATPGTFLPAFDPEELPRLTPATTLARSTSSENLGLFRKPDYVGGEVGVFYGRSVGSKFSREVEQGYILGEIVDGNTHIQVGASYGRSSGSNPKIIGR
ncbi:MAG: hypothetical protein ABIR29_10375 [Chthoniobacterales bacterium]